MASCALPAVLGPASWRARPEAHLAGGARRSWRAGVSIWGAPVRWRSRGWFVRTAPAEPRPRRSRDARHPDPRHRVPPRHRVRPLSAAVCALAGATALIHLWLGALTSVMLATQPELVASLGGATMLTVMAALFYANAAGDVVLPAALYLPHPVLRRFRRVTRWALIGFTAVTVVAYFAMIQGHVDALGLADKAIEVLLIALLVVEDRRADYGPPAGPAAARRRAALDRDAREAGRIGPAAAAPRCYHGADARSPPAGPLPGHLGAGSAALADTDPYQPPLHGHPRRRDRRAQAARPVRDRRAAGRPGAARLRRAGGGAPPARRRRRPPARVRRRGRARDAGRAG